MVNINMGQVLEDAVRLEATDIHIVPDLPVMHRRAGRLQPASEVVLSANDTRRLCYALLDADQIRSFETGLDLDLIKTGQEHRFRINLNISNGRWAP